MSLRNLFSTFTSTAADIITKSGQVIEVNLDSVHKLSMAGNHTASEIEREAKLDLDKAMHRLAQQEAEFLKDLEAIEVQL